MTATSGHQAPRQHFPVCRARCRDGDFSLRYQPWDERLCMVPNGDLFVALRGQRASIVTGQIERFDATGIVMQSGAHLDADIVIAATGLRLSLLTGVALVDDGEFVALGTTMIYKGMTKSDVPNMAAAVRYTNALTTLKRDPIAPHVCRLLNSMRARDFAHAETRPSRHVAIPP